MAAEDDLPDFDETQPDTRRGALAAKTEGETGAIRASGFKDFLLKQEIMQGIVECGFEHPSEVQHACIPQAVLGTDILCQAKAGMGKTAVFVVSCLQLVDTSESAVRVLVLGHTRELAYQIEHEFKRLGKHMPGMKVRSVIGGSPLEKDKEMLKEPPQVLVGTPGRVLGLLRNDGPLKLDKLTHFILDEADQCIDNLEMRRDVQQVFIKTPKKKQVMMFSATLSPETRGICKKFMQTPHEILVECETKLKLDGLLQYYVKLEEKAKNKKLIDLLDTLEFNQVVIFVRTVKRALALDGILREANFPSMTLHQLPEEFKDRAKKTEVPNSTHDRIQRLQLFKDFHKRILVTTDLFGRGMDVERLNIVINYDMPEDDTMYLHRVGRAGRFGTKGLAVSLVSSESDSAVLGKVQSRFEVNIEEMPNSVDTTSYLNA